MKTLSIVIPVYKGEDYIKKNLLVYQDQLKRLKKKNQINQFEIIVIIDGEVDNSHLLTKTMKGIKLYSYQKNRGKGYALRYGFSKSSGEYVVFVDSGDEYNLLNLVHFFSYFPGTDMVVGSKRHPFSRIHYPFHRRVLSRGFRFLSKFILGIKLRDTQSGFKVFKREAFELLSPCFTIDGFCFDLEFCFLAQKYGFQISEAPVKLLFGKKSTIYFSSIFKMFFDIFKIRYQFSIKGFYQKKFKSFHFDSSLK